MSRHDDRIRLRHRLDHAREALALSRGKARAELGRNRLLELALVRLIEIIGEAAARVSDAGQKQLPGIPWRQVVGLRNRLIHGYDEVDLDILWEIVQGDLPRLIAELERVPDG